MLSALVRVAYRGRLDPHEHAIIIPESSLSPWRFDEGFNAAYEQIRAFTLVDEMRLYELWALAGQLDSVPGDIIEIGVWRGGSGCLLAMQGAQGERPATVYLCDTFAGVVHAGAGRPDLRRRRARRHLDRTGRVTGPVARSRQRRAAGGHVPRRDRPPGRGSPLQAGPPRRRRVRIDQGIGGMAVASTRARWCRRRRRLRRRRDGRCTQSRRRVRPERRAAGCSTTSTGTPFW